MSEGRRWSTPPKRRERKLTLPLSLCSVQTLMQLGEAQPHWRARILLTQTTDSKVNLFQEHLTDTRRNNGQKLAGRVSLILVK